MSFDLSRVSFDARRDFLGVIQAQGRVGLDADWNEWVAQLLRRLQVGSLDGLDGTVVPRTTPRGFEIRQEKGTLTIGPGRMYVDGLLAENHGLLEEQGGKSAGWDPRLAELVGAEAVDFAKQPYQPYLKDPKYLDKQLKVARKLPEKGSYLVYLDVWQRDITALQEPRLIEPAVGVETTGRRQTVWQVKLLPNDRLVPISCSSRDEDIPGWKELIAPVPVRLSTRTVDPPVVENPCEVAAEAGYGGLENQLYRVEVHNPGPLGTATLKWSRDNGSIAAGVTHIDASRVTLTVTSLGRDDVLGFRQGGWVEVSDDWRVLAGQPGELRRIQRILADTHQLELDRPLPAGLFATDGQGATDPVRHTLVRRWDNDPNDPDDGLPIPAAGEWLQLEHGIEVQISLDPQPKPGEAASIPAGAHWVFAARTSTGALLDPLEKAPPLGIHHHFARLAVVTFPAGSVSDCRRLWPPEVAGGCDCTVCVTPEGHKSGKATLQMAIDQVQAMGGGTVCLGVGRYELGALILVQEASALRIRGQGWTTQLLAGSPGLAMAIRQSNGVTLENLTLIGSAVKADPPQPLVLAQNTNDLRLEHCNLIAAEGEGGTSVGLGLNGTILGASLHQCAVAAGLGVARVALPGPASAAMVLPEEQLVTAGLKLENNVLLCRERCLSFDGPSYHHGHTILRDNILLATNPGGGMAVLATGAVLPHGQFRIEGNLIDTYGDGIRAGVDGLLISGNTLVGQGLESGDAIHLLEGLDPRGPRRVSIRQNRIEGFRGNAVRQTHRLGLLEVCDNQVEGIGLGALVMGEAAGAERLLCRDNSFMRLGEVLVEGNVGFAAVQLLAVQQAELRGNCISEVAVRARDLYFIEGVRALGVEDLQLAENHFTDIGPPEGRVTSVCVRVVTPFERVGISGNRFLQGSDEGAALRPPAWGAVVIGDDPDSSIRYLSQAHVIQDPKQFFGLTQGAGILLTEKQFLVLNTRARDVALQGNSVDAMASRIPQLEVRSAGHLGMSGNVLQREKPADQFLADLSGETVSANDNRFATPPPKSATLRIATAKKRPVVVMGNTSTGEFVMVNGASIPADINLTNFFES